MYHVARSRRERVEKEKFNFPKWLRWISLQRHCFTVAGEEVVTVPSTSNGQESWKAQRLSVNGESPQSSNRRRGCRPQLQPVVSGGKRNRPAPPPPSQPISYRVNAKDRIDGYDFDWPNKENTPGNAVNRREDDHQTNPNQATEESIMGSNLSRHNGKGLTGRRTQSSGNLCDPKGKLNSMGKILVPCSSAQRERLVVYNCYLFHY